MSEKFCQKEMLRLIRDNPEMGYGHALAEAILNDRKQDYSGVYVGIRRCVKDGRLEVVKTKSPYHTPEGRKTKRRRRYYQITEKGREYLNESDCS